MTESRVRLVVEGDGAVEALEVGVAEEFAFEGGGTRGLASSCDVGGLA